MKRQSTSASAARGPLSVAVVGVCVVLVVACAGAPDVPVSSTAATADVVAPPVGVADRGDDPAVVAVVVGGEAPCAGALIAPDVVLTALHCVAASDAPVTCADGGATALSLLPPGSVRVLVGDDMATAAERARGRRLVAPPSARLCGADLALVLLDQPIDDVAPLVVRSTGAARGDHVRTVGYGRAGATQAKLLREHVTVLDTSETELEVAETPMPEGGGPALDEATEAIVGVVSRGGREASEAVYTRPDAFASLIAGALAMSASAPATSTGTLKVKKGPADMGADCTSGADCAAGVCVSAASATQQYCSRSCGAHDRCPSLYACQRTQEGDQVCVRR